MKNLTAQMREFSIERTPGMLFNVTVEVSCVFWRSSAYDTVDTVAMAIVCVTD